MLPAEILMLVLLIVPLQKGGKNVIVWVSILSLMLIFNLIIFIPFIVTELYPWKWIFAHWSEGNYFGKLLLCVTFVITLPSTILILATRLLIALAFPKYRK